MKTITDILENDENYLTPEDREEGKLTLAELSNALFRQFDLLEIMSDHLTLNFPEPDHFGKALVQRMSDEISVISGLIGNE